MVKDRLSVLQGVVHIQCPKRRQDMVIEDEEAAYSSVRCTQLKRMCNSISNCYQKLLVFMVMCICNLRDEIQTFPLYVVPVPVPEHCSTR